VTTIDANLDRLTFNNHVETLNRFPTVRGDVNISDKHRFSSALNYQRYNTFPDTLNNRDPSFPGFPAAAGQTSERLGFSNWMRSTFTSRLVNEARVDFDQLYNNLISSGSQDHAAVVQNVLNELLYGWIFEIRTEFGAAAEAEIVQLANRLK